MGLAFGILCARVENEFRPSLTRLIKLSVVVYVGVVIYASIFAVMHA